MSGYWDYYRAKPPKEVKDGIKTKSRRGDIGERWWSKRWITLLESFKIGERLARGRAYARKGQVISIDIRKGLVISKVQGVQNDPYEIEIKVVKLSRDDWEKAIDLMAKKAIFAARLLSGEMPKDIEDAFAEANVSLFPSKKDLKTSCSCPDWSNPCKHIAAVYYLLAEQFDEDPFLIFKLRGRSKEELIEALRKRRTIVVDKNALHNSSHDLSLDLDFGNNLRVPLVECIETFWDIGEGIDALAPSPAPPKVPHAVLKRLGDAPYSIDKKNLASFFPKAFEVAGLAALQKAAWIERIGPLK